MKKQYILKAILILLPVLAVGLAMKGDSVMLIDSVTGVTQTYSYFDLVPGAAFPVAAPLAGLTAIVSGGCAMIYLFARRRSVLEVIRWTAFAGACVAVVPIVARGEVVMVPSVAVPILLLAEFVLGGILAKGFKEDKNAERPTRLEPR